MTETPRQVANGTVRGDEVQDPHATPNDEGLKTDGQRQRLVPSSTIQNASTAKRSPDESSWRQRDMNGHETGAGQVDGH